MNKQMVVKIAYVSPELRYFALNGENLLQSSGYLEGYTQGDWSGTDSWE